jgi:2-polyprenyl-3-methyl-5-hydroxy-6-metoxy-1,4-benzoquinol methylase
MTPEAASDKDFEAEILTAWHRDAAPWTAVVRDGQIASRRQVTDAAVVNAVCGLQPVTVMDLGCGEGWLVRALTARGLSVLGVDAVAALIDAADAQGGGRYICLDYAAIAEGALRETADAVVCNFALLGGDSVAALLQAVPRLLNPGGALVIQTLHPRAALSGGPYQEGWRDGTWAGIKGDFGPAPPWYFRTLESWERLLHDSGFSHITRREPCWPETGEPASLLLVARV